MIGLPAVLILSSLASTTLPSKFDVIQGVQGILETVPADRLPERKKPWTDSDISAVNHWIDENLKDCTVALTGTIAHETKLTPDGRPHVFIECKAFKFNGVDISPGIVNVYFDKDSAKARHAKVGSQFKVHGVIGSIQIERGDHGSLRPTGQLQDAAED